MNNDIFVSTCGFNERYIRETIENAYDMAADPDRVSFGIFDQKSSGVPIENYKGLKRVRVVHASADEPVGVGQARLNASLLHAGEKYLCQIDSHNLFAQDWQVFPQSPMLFRGIVVPIAVPPPCEKGDQENCSKML